jgi:hypothetical protein
VREPNGRITINDDTAIIDAQHFAARACITAIEAVEAFAAEIVPADATFTPTKGRHAGKLLDREGIMWLDTKMRFRRRAAERARDPVHHAVAGSLDGVQDDLVAAPRRDPPEA